MKKFSFTVLGMTYEREDRPNSEREKTDDPVIRSSEKQTMTTGSQRLNIRVYGMHCASCAAVIERSIKKLPGVKEVNVNYGAEKAHVIFDGASINEAMILERIKSAGYRGEVARSQDQEGDKRQREEEIQHYRTQFLVGAIFSVPLLYFMLMEIFPFLP